MTNQAYNVITNVINKITNSLTIKSSMLITIQHKITDSFEFNKDVVSEYMSLENKN